MSIEYLPGVAVGGKIDVSKFEKKKSLNYEGLRDDFSVMLGAKAEQYNRDFGTEWLDEKGAVKFFNSPSLESDQQLVESKERQWASETGKGLKHWRRDKEKDPAILTEMALTIFLQRVLPGRFMVVRSCVFDDYENGVDQLIIDRETGLVVCGIDEVIDRDGYSGPNKKVDKVRHKMETGGINVKYGVTVRDCKLEQKSFNNIPAFYLSLTKADLGKLGEAFKETGATVYEKVLLQDTIASLRAQARSYESLELKPKLKEEVTAFTNSLENWSQ